MADLIGQLLEREAELVEQGKFPNPWIDQEFNSCELDIPEPGLAIDDISERTGTVTEGGTTTETTGAESAGCLWKKRSGTSDIYYEDGAAAVGTSEPRSDYYKFHSEEGHLGAVGKAGEDIFVDAVGVV